MKLASSLISYFFIFLLFPIFAFSEEQCLITRTIHIGEDIGQLGKYIIHPDKTAMLKLLGVAAGTTGLILLDEDIRGEVKKRSGQTLDAMERIFEPMGRWEIQAVVGGGVLGAGYLMEDRKLIEATITGLEAYLISGTLVTLIKFSTGRKRPYEEQGSGAFYDGGVSFPSGHTARSFAWAAVMSEYYHDKKWVPPLSYSLATLVGLSRMESDRHWASDVFFGACLGFSIGKGLSHQHLQSKDNVLSISPIITEDTVLLSSRIKF